MSDIDYLRDYAVLDGNRLSSLWSTIDSLRAENEKLRAERDAANKRVGELTRHLTVSDEEELALRSRVEQLEKALTDTHARMVCLHKFADRMLQDWPDVGADGFAIQEAAVEAGLLATADPKPTEPCGECCNCVEYYDRDEWSGGIDCYRKTAVMKDSLDRVAIAQQDEQDET